MDLCITMYLRRCVVTESAGELCPNEYCVVSVSVIERHIAHKPSELSGKLYPNEPSRAVSIYIIYIYVCMCFVGKLCRNSTIAST